MRKTRVVASTVIIALAAGFTAIAGTWKSDANGWWYDEGNGSCLKSTWSWIDSNNDGESECYYFDERGYMAANRDVGGYWVNADGQWVDIYGNVQKKIVNNGLNNMPAEQGSNAQENVAKDNNSVNNSNTNSGDIEPFLPNGELNPVYLAEVQEWNRKQEEKEAKLSSGQPDENWRDYLYLMSGVKWAAEKAESEGAHVYWDGNKITWDWPNGDPYESKTSSDDGTSLEEKRERILKDINKYRKKAGKEPLELDDELNDYAQIRAEECEEKYSHVRPNGEYFNVGLPSSASCGENIAVGTYKNVAKIWYNSPGHKRLMLSSYEKCGIGIYDEYIVLDLIG